MACAIAAYARAPDRAAIPPTSRASRMYEGARLKAMKPGTVSTPAPIMLAITMPTPDHSPSLRADVISSTHTAPRIPRRTPMTEIAHPPGPPRFHYARAAAGGYQAMLALEAFLHTSGLNEPLIHLVKLRVSQINGCAFCIDMHWKDLRAIGEREQRLYGLDAWEESPYYTDRERAALTSAEAITNIQDGHASDDAYQAVRGQFSDK